MDNEQKNILLKIVKQTLTATLKNESLPVIDLDDPQLSAKSGCFVTLKNSEKLRGCIGQFISDIPLYSLVQQMAVASSTADPRFANDPITISELDSLNVEISVLSPLQRTTDPLTLRLGIDGIYIKKGYTSGCFLPQVATETGWTKQEFLSYCCSHKAGLPPDAWQDPETEVYLFTADVFDKDFKEI